MLKRSLIIVFMLSSLPFIYLGTASSDISVFQGQYFIGEQLQNGIFNFTFNVYDNSVGGNLVYTASQQLQTGNWGQWKTELQGISAAANDTTKDYFMEIIVDGTVQGERRRITSFNYIRKDVDDYTSASITSSKQIIADTLQSQSQYLVAIVAETGGIAKGQPVYSFGSLNNALSVKIAKKSDFTKSGVIGVAQESKNVGESILIVTGGVVSGIDTSSYLEGEKLYLDEGFMSNSPPTRGQAFVEMGNVIRSDRTNGSILLDKISHNIVVNKSGAAGFNIVNTNPSMTTSAAINFFNNIGSRFSIFLGSNNSSSNFPNGAVLYNEGGGIFAFNLAGNSSPFLWRVNPVGVGALDLMRLLPNGQLVLYQGGINTSGDIISRGKLACLEDGTNCNFTSNITSSISSLSSQLSSLNSSSSALSANISELYASLSSLNSSSTNNRESIQSINSSIQSSIAGINSSILSLIASQASLAQSITNLNLTNSNLSNNISLMQNSISILSQSLSNMNQSLSSINQSLSSLNQISSSLQSSFSSLNSSVASSVLSLNQSQNAINNSLIQLSQTLSAINSSLTQAINSLNSSINSINQAISSLNASISNLRSNDTLLTITNRNSTTNTTITAVQFFGSLNWSYLISTPSIIQNLTLQGAINGSLILDSSINNSKIISINSSKIFGDLNDSQVVNDITINSTKNISTSGDVCAGSICLRNVSSASTGVVNYSGVPVRFISTVDGSLAKTTVYLTLGTKSTASTTSTESSWIIDRNMTITKILWNADSNARTDISITLMKSSTTKSALADTAAVASVGSSTKGSSAVSVRFAESDLIAMKYTASTSNTTAQIKDLSITVVGRYD